MIEAITSLASGAWPWIVSIGGALLGVVWAYRKGARDTTNARDAADLRRDVENRDTRAAVDRDIARDPDPAAGLQRGKWFRD
jgi:hypothetical protein